MTESGRNIGLPSCWASRPADGYPSSNPATGGVLSSRGSSRSHLHESDADFARDGERALVAVELSIDDAGDAGVGRQLEARPAGRGGGVQVGAVDSHAVAGGLQN